MGSLAGHISAFVFLVPIGVRRLIAALSVHLRSPPSSFRARPWYFSDHPSPHGRLLRNADLFALLLSLPIAAFSSFFLFLTLSSPPPHRLPFALHSALLLLFWLLLLLPIALRHAIDPPAALLPDSLVFLLAALHSALLLLFWLLLLLPIALRHALDPPAALLPYSLVFLLAALAFLADHALSSAPAGPSLDARASALSSAATLACAGACAALAVRPAAVAAEAGLSLGLVMKGTWALQAGVTLYAAAPPGCGRRAGWWGPVECELDEDRARGVAMLDLLFAGHAVGVAAVGVGVYWVLARAAAGRPADLDAMITRPMMMAGGDLEMD